MYKTISIHNNTYQQLHALAVKLQKPKSQVIHDLISEHLERMHAEEKNSLKNFNAFVRNLSKRVKLPRGLILDFDKLTPANLLEEIDTNKALKRKNSGKISAKK